MSYTVFFVKYALINFWSPNQHTISIDLLPIMIKADIGISKQRERENQY